MAEIQWAKKIEVDQHKKVVGEAEIDPDHPLASLGGKRVLTSYMASIKIDGEEFPWYLKDLKVNLPEDDDDTPSVTVTIYADRVVLDSTNLSFAEGVTAKEYWSES